MSHRTLNLPTNQGSLEPWEPSGRPYVEPVERAPRSRIAYASVHVVADPLSPADPTEGVALDWDATLAFRHHIWACGLGVAEAMDTAQRGMGLDWATTCELITRTGAEARASGGSWCAGVGTDQLPPGAASVEDVVTAWREQMDVVSEAGAVPVVMASRALAAAASTPEDYHRAYGKLLSNADDPAILHWLGEPFDPALAGYWGHTDVLAAARELVAICRDHEAAIDGVKISVLDAEVEKELRSALPRSVACYTGDDFNFASLIAGDEHHYSEALLGIFDPIAPVASAALGRLDEGDLSGYRELLDPTVPLSREIFKAPTSHYKVGVVFLAYLAGHQSHFRMVGGLESARSVTHLAEVLRLADRAGVLPDTDLAVERMRPILATAGV